MSFGAWQSGSGKRIFFLLVCGGMCAFVPVAGAQGTPGRAIEFSMPHDASLATNLDLRGSNPFDAQNVEPDTAKSLSLTPKTSWDSLNPLPPPPRPSRRLNNPHKDPILGSPEDYIQNYMMEQIFKTPGQSDDGQQLTFKSALDNLYGFPSRSRVATNHMQDAESWSSLSDKKPGVSEPLDSLLGELHSVPDARPDNPQSSLLDFFSGKNNGVTSIEARRAQQLRERQIEEYKSLLNTPSPVAAFNNFTPGTPGASRSLPETSSSLNHNPFDSGNQPLLGFSGVPVAPSAPTAPKVPVAPGQSSLAPTLEYASPAPVAPDFSPPRRRF